MPLGAPIGSGLGIQNKTNIKLITEQSAVPVIVDAGVGTASDATIAMELGCDGVLINTAIAEAKDSILMAESMKHAVISGRRLLKLIWPISISSFGKQFNCSFILSAICLRVSLWVDIIPSSLTLSSLRSDNFISSNFNSLLIFWKHRESTFIGKWKVEYVFLWKMDEGLIKKVERDYKDIIKRIKNQGGIRCTDKDGNDIKLPKDCKTKDNRPCETGLHQSTNDFLTTCPKHSSKPSFKTRRTSANSSPQPKRKENAEKRAFRFKTSFVLFILEKYIKKSPENGILVF